MIKLQYEIAQIVSMLRAHTPHRLAITSRVLNSIRSLNSWHMNKLTWILRGQYNDYPLIALDILSPWFCQQFDMFVHMLYASSLGPPTIILILHTNNWYRVWMCIMLLHGFDSQIHFTHAIPLHLMTKMYHFDILYLFSWISWAELTSEFLVF